MIILDDVLPFLTDIQCSDVDIIMSIVGKCGATLYRVYQKSDTLLVSEFSTFVRCIICNFCLLTHHFH